MQILNYQEKERPQHKEHFRQVYYEALDETVKCIRDRFDQKDFKLFRNTQEVLLKAVKGEDHSGELAKVMAIYGDDIQKKPA